MKRPKIGDVIEITTSMGFAYAQYTHKNKMYDCLLRVFKGFHQERPKSFEKIVTQEPVFSTFFPLGAAVNRQIVSIAGHEKITSDLQILPLFRNGILNPQTKKVEVWWLWDGEKSWKVGEITQEQRKLPLLGIWNDTMLIKRIESGWTAEKTDW